MPHSWTATLWTDDIAEVDHAPLGLARLIWQYRGDQPRLQKILEAYLIDSQSIEDVTVEVLVGRWPLTAIGDQLDTLGAIVQQGRRGLADDPYRLFILGRIFVNLSDGKVDELYTLLDTLGAIDGVLVDEYYPASIRIDVIGATYGEIIGELVHDWAGGGVRTLWVWNAEADADDCFAMGDTLGTDEINTTGGFGDLTGATQTTGGYFSGSRS